LWEKIKLILKCFKAHIDIHLPKKIGGAIRNSGGLKTSKPPPLVTPMIIYIVKKVLTGGIYIFLQVVKTNRWNLHFFSSGKKKVQVELT